MTTCWRVRVGFINTLVAGDSGGPLLQLDIPYGDYTLGEPSYDLVVGITSFGENSGDTFKPGVYTSVSYFRHWIDCIIEEKVRVTLSYYLVDYIREQLYHYEFGVFRRNV